MGRVAREELLYDGCFAHIISRSFDQSGLFHDHQDFEQFKHFLSDAKVNANFFIHHYCFMHTHFHLAVCVSDVHEFSEAMKNLKREYTYWHNVKYKRVGPLWRERYKSLLIEDEMYLYACGQYIELNPLKANLVRQPEDWPFSSSRFYSLGEEDSLIDDYDRSNTNGLIGMDDEEFFEKGPGIGSPMFRLLAQESIRATCPSSKCLVP